MVLLTTFHKGKANVMTMSWHSMIDFEPPLVACVVSNRNYSFDLLKKSKECVLNIPTQKNLQQIVGVGNSRGEKIDKFKKYKLTPLPASTVSAPLLKECYACLECKVVDTKLVNKYNLFFLEVQKAWFRGGSKSPSTVHHLGRGKFMIAGKTISMPGMTKAK